MGKQNITLALPEETIREARHLAVERGVSVSRLLAEYLQRLLREDADYDAAMKRAMGRMKKGFRLGSDGKRPASREALHER